MLGQAAQRIVLATLLVVSSLVVVTVAPASAETVVVSCSGVCGSWQVQDSRHVLGARCFYTSQGFGWLYRISVRPPVVYGRYHISTTVRWRFVIEQTYSTGWLHDYTSSYQSAQADLTTSASLGHGFSWRAWANFPKGPLAYRVIVEMQWQQNGSTEGYAKVRYNWYLTKSDGGAAKPSPGSCANTFD